MIRKYAKQGGILVPLNSMSSPIANLNDGVNTATTDLVRVNAVASATPHTKGSWAQYIASVSQDISYIEVDITGTNTNGSDTSALLDIGIGGAGSEVPIVSDIAAGFKTSDRYLFPVKIPAGTRIAIRAQSVIGSLNVPVGIRFRTATFDIASSGIVTMGANAATSNGVTLPTAAANTKGAWAEIIASTPNAFQALIPTIQLATGSTSVASNNVLVDIGIGAAGSETAFIKDILYQTGSSESIIGTSVIPYHEVEIPAGTRLSARYQRAVTNQNVALILHGVKN